MALPPFNPIGNLPTAVYRATREDVVARFGKGSARRQEITQRFLLIHATAKATDKLDRFILFGSYITDKANPNDVDVVLVMRDSFSRSDCDEATWQ